MKLQEKWLHGRWHAHLFHQVRNVLSRRRGKKSVIMRNREQNWRTYANHSATNGTEMSSPAWEVKQEWFFNNSPVRSPFLYSFYSKATLRCSWSLCFNSFATYCAIKGNLVCGMLVFILKNTVRRRLHVCYAKISFRLFSIKLSAVFCRQTANCSSFLCKKLKVPFLNE